MFVSMPGVVYTNYRQSQVITGGRLLRWKNCELIDTMPDNSVSASDIRRSKIVALTVTESLKTARNALTRAEQQLTQQKNTPDGKTIVSPEKFPGRSSTNHSIVVSGDPRFAGTIKITTSAVIDNRANLNYLLTHSGLDYKRNILNDRNPVVTEDVEGDKKIYNAEVAEWDKLRQRLLDARNKITSAESAINSARNNVSARTNEQKHANDALNALLKEKENIRSQLADINQKIAEEKIINKYGEFLKLKIVSNIFSDHNAMRLEIPTRKRKGKNTNTWRLSATN